jgi:hypothetical protein
MNKVRKAFLTKASRDAVDVALPAGIGAMVYKVYLSPQFEHVSHETFLRGQIRASDGHAYFLSAGLGKDPVTDAELEFVEQTIRTLLMFRERPQQPARK